MRLRVAARPSRLSLIQVEIAMAYIRRRLGQVEYELVPVESLGDRVRDRPLHELGATGVFESNVDGLVLEGRADVAVHSLKDLPSRLPNGLAIASVPPRGPPEDSLVPARGKPPRAPEELPPGTRVAAGSPRRRLMILHANPRVEATWIRGNLDTRLRRLDEGRADYLVAAEAGLERLGVERPRVRLPVVPYTPAPGQGTVAVVAPLESSIYRLLSQARDPRAWRETMAERAFLEELRAGCSKPLGALARAIDGTVRVTAALYSHDHRAAWVTVDHRDPMEAGARAAEAIRSLPWF